MRGLLTSEGRLLWVLTLCHRLLTAVGEAFSGLHFGQTIPNIRFPLGSVIPTDCQCVEQRSFNRGAAWTETCKEKSAGVCFVLHFMLTHFFRDNHTRSDLNI